MYLFKTYQFYWTIIYLILALLCLANENFAQPSNQLPDIENNDSTIIANQYQWALNKINTQNCDTGKIIVYRNINNRVLVLIEETTSSSIYNRSGSRLLDNSVSLNNLIRQEDYQISEKIADWSCDCGFGCHPSFQDHDGDGYSPIMGDCNDIDPTIHPFAIDIPNDSINSDCLGGDLDSILLKRVGISLTDKDGDGYYREINDCNDNPPNEIDEGGRNINPGNKDTCPKIRVSKCGINPEVSGDTIIVNKFVNTGIEDKSAANFHFKVYIFNNNWEIIDSCGYNQSCSRKIKFDSLQSGNYYVYLQSFSSDWLQIDCDTILKKTIEEEFGDILIDMGLNDSEIEIGDDDVIINEFNTTNCQSITVEKQGKNLLVGNPNPAPKVILELFNENYYLVDRHIGESGPIIICDTLHVGQYFLKVKYYDEDWNFICELNEEVHFTNDGAQFGAPVSQSRRSKNPTTLTAYLNKNNIKLQWAQTNNQPKQQFIIEKSTNGQQFKPISTITAQNQLTYTDLDYHPIKGVNFYRLITQFEDGHLEHSEIIPVIWTPTGKLQLFPNPAADFIQLSMKAYIDTEIDLVIVNQLGKVVHRQHFDKVNTPTIEINTANFSEGLHIVSVINKGQATSEKFIRIRRE